MSVVAGGIPGRILADFDAVALQNVSLQGRQSVLVASEKDEVAIRDSALTRGKILLPQFNAFYRSSVIMTR